MFPSLHVYILICMLPFQSLGGGILRGFPKSGGLVVLSEAFLPQVGVVVILAGSIDDTTPICPASTRTLSV